MISATKGPAPRCLTPLAAGRLDWETDVYGGQRQEIREALVRDQGSLCAYCQRRVRASERAMRIDHWHPRTAGGEHFQWSNLVGSCANHGTCDDHKGETPLFLHPFRGQGADPREHLRYNGAGVVEARDPRAAPDIATLNLNAFNLQRGRKQSVSALLLELKTSGFKVSALLARLRSCEALSRTEAPEYASVLAYELRRWLRKHGAEPQR